MTGKPIDDVVQALIEVAVGKVRHLYRGTCPDEIEGFDSRDPQCPACQVLAAVQQPPADGVQAGEVFGWVLGNAFVDARFWTGETPPQGWIPVYCTAPPSAPVGEVCIRLNGIGEGGPYPVVNGVCVLPQSVAENLVASTVGQQVKRELLAQWASYKQPADVDEAVRLLREYREAPKFSNDHDAIKRTVALEDEIDAFLAAITTYEQEGKESFWPKLPGSGGPDWTGHD